jgi:exopolysaccharide biosynthesis polyprenyl glycosylphosphotransferase
VLGTETGVALSGPALDALTEVVTRQRPDLIVLADDQSSAAALDRLLDIADGRFRVAGLTSFYEYALGCVPVHQITPMWFMSLLHVRQRTYGRWVKRAFDVLTAAFALLITAPLLPLIALAVRGTPGPIIYRQIRVGDGGRRFKIYKFRTMVDGAERPGEAVWAKDADPRSTPVGAFLRRTHLDELPQLFNVLKGDMSIVGPRPERPELIAALEASIPFWNRRHLIKPGMTGWAQVHCGYAADFAAAYEKLAYDFWYLRHRSLAVDLAICVRTLQILLEILEPGRVALRRLLASRHHAAP